MTSDEEKKIKLVAGLLGKSENQIYQILGIQKRALQLLKKAITIGEVKYVCEIVPPDSEAEELAFKKWIDLCTTLEELSEAFNAMSNNAIRYLVFDKWDEMGIKMVDEATSVEECRQLYQLVPENGGAEGLLLAKWKDLAVEMVQESLTIEEAKAAYYASPDYGEAKKLAVEKLLQLV